MELPTATETFQQKVINNNVEIFETIKYELSNAQSEILIASSWFTDNELLDILILQLKKGVKVNLIISDNSDNEKLPFDNITTLGGVYIKIKNVGYGIMHQKFCVIDRHLAIHGSYNYTNNAKKNNHESVIYTTHSETVKSLIDTFNSIMDKANEIVFGLNGLEKEPSKKENLLDNSLTPPNIVQEKLDYKQEFERVLSTLIEAEINHFNRIELYDNGYKRSESCGGDHNILPNALDTIYYNFINDINISEEQKKMLLVKINEHKSKSIQLLDTELANRLNNIKIEFQNNKDIYSRTIKEKIVDIEKAEKKIEGIRNIEIESIKKSITEIKEKINNLKREFIKPQIKKFEFYPLVILSGFLLIYLFLFYSSAAYILVFSKVDIMQKIKQGLEVPAHTVFEPHALSLAFNHGAVSLIMILVFVSLPIGFALAHRYVDNKLVANILSYFIGIFVVDTLVAIFISKAIQEAKNLTNESPDKWSFTGMAITDVNFYLVFVMGAAALLVFKFVFDKLMKQFEERSSTIHIQKANLEIEQKTEEISILEKEIVEREKNIESLQIETMEYKKIINDHQYNLDYLPTTENRELEKSQTEYLSKKQHYEHISAIYINKVETNNPKISIDALRDRINTFLEGWNDYLHKYFSYTIAADKSKNATSTTSDWLTQKLSSNKIDPRINN
ncbi:phospholipase D-like domain-containing protein [Runella salmonicolor]|uniref:phospholipase D n=1 Tax=Runella salmonicolor TaxID=2950278 RepID=A0ABT1FTU3_9BACT|nr:phospholipase D-like domain-containing protein [Runella salmonicolor]MCP1384063.1 phospholipase D-like domain-containing protein [Runella salmonicolor]